MGNFLRKSNIIDENTPLLANTNNNIENHIDISYDPELGSKITINAHSIHLETQSLKINGKSCNLEEIKIETTDT